MNGKTVFAFVVGAVAGAVGAWYYLNKLYFSDVEEPEEEQPDIKREVTAEPEDETDEAARIEYQKVSSQYNCEEEKKKGPYMIDRDEFGDGTMPTTVTYSYFEDGILTDEYNQIVDDADVKEAIGEDFVNHFGDEDLAYVRNESRHCDYEILREGITYYEPPEEE